jgi:hypothetical protein
MSRLDITISTDLDENAEINQEAHVRINDTFVKIERNGRPGYYMTEECPVVFVNQAPEKPYEIEFANLINNSAAVGGYTFGLYTEKKTPEVGVPIDITDRAILKTYDSRPGSWTYKGETSPFTFQCVNAVQKTKKPKIDFQYLYALYLLKGLPVGFGKNLYVYHVHFAPYGIVQIDTLEGPVKDKTHSGMSYLFKASDEFFHHLCVKPGTQGDCLVFAYNEYFAKSMAYRRLNNEVIYGLIFGPYMYVVTSNAIIACSSEKNSADALKNNYPDQVSKIPGHIVCTFTEMLQIIPLKEVVALKTSAVTVKKERVDKKK